MLNDVNEKWKVKTANFNYGFRVIPSWIQNIVDLGMSSKVENSKSIFLSEMFLSHHQRDISSGVSWVKCFAKWKLMIEHWLKHVGGVEKGKSIVESFECSWNWNVLALQIAKFKFTTDECEDLCARNPTLILGSVSPQYLSSKTIIKFIINRHDD